MVGRPTGILAGASACSPKVFPDGVPVVPIAQQPAQPGRRIPASISGPREVFIVSGGHRSFRGAPPENEVQLNEHLPLQLAGKWSS